MLSPSVRLLSLACGLLSAVLAGVLGSGSLGTSPWTVLLALALTAYTGHALNQAQGGSGGRSFGLTTALTLINSAVVAAALWLMFEAGRFSPGLWVSAALATAVLGMIAVDWRARPGLATAGGRG